ncbi:hypothetical protein QTP81_14845 [Alteromonas sp. ASW11-36]|uniref:Tetratricopeptide repeat protein n=1 Tax=Alteromonas arenosi TaxID=3055817 RepID=A0ABT7T0A6_9ALTE|nr:hypothetical protein [Alteromonas sp. ASW11-36]MDM7861878.1 hypothetical protein [Alteromonas sp. ASW11-36]
MKLPLFICRILLSVTLATSSSMSALAASYYEIAERLAPREHTQLRQQWLEANPFNSEQLAVIDAIQAFYNNNVVEAEKRLTPLLLQASNPETHYWAGRIYGRLASEASIFNASSLAEKALDSFKRSVSLNPDFIPGHHALVQYYIRAPFFAGGSTDKARESARILNEIAPLEGALAQLNIALYEEDKTLILAQLDSFEKILSNEEQHSPESLSGNYFRIALHYMQLARYHEAFQALNVSLSHTDKALATPLGESPEEQLKRQERRYARQAILYQIGRLGVLSETNIKIGIAALESFLEGPKHPTYERHWAQLRYAQLLFKDGQALAAKDIIEALQIVDNEHYMEELDQLRKRIRKHVS